MSYNFWNQWFKSLKFKNKLQKIQNLKINGYVWCKVYCRILEVDGSKQLVYSMVKVLLLKMLLALYKTESNEIEGIFKLFWL